MFRQFLVALMVLLGAGVSFGAPGDPNYVPMECATTHYDVLLDWVNGNGRTDDGDPDDDPFTYICTVAAQDYVMRVGHVGAAVSNMEAWSDYDLDRVASEGVVVWMSEETISGAWWQLSHFYTTGGQNPKVLYTGTKPDRSGNLDLEIPGNDRATTDAIAAAQYEDLLHSSGILFLGSALQVIPSLVTEARFIAELELAFYGGLMDLENLPPGVGDGPGGPGDPGGPGEGGDPNAPYKPGDAVGRCGHGEGLSWFEAGISRMFQPCEDWPAKWGALATERDQRVPFGFVSWVPWFGGSSPGTGLHGDELMFGCMRWGRDMLGNNLCSERIEILGHELQPVRLSEVAAFEWWHETGREWLYYGLVLGFVFGMIRLVIS